MNRIIKLLLIIAVIFSVAPIMAKAKRSEKLTPTWVKSTPKSINSSQQFVVVMDEGTSLDNIRKNRYINLQNYLDNEVMTEGVVRTKVTQSSNDSYLDFVTSIKGGKYNQTQIDEYWEMVGRSTYRHYYLYSISTSATTSSYNIRATTSYGFGGAWRSMLVPGWGQFYKGSKAKGGLMLGGVAVAAVAAVYSNTMADDYYSKMSHTYDVNAIRSYKTKGDQFASIRNVCFGAAGAIYLYSIIDAIAAPGARRIKVKKGAKGVDYNVAPMVSNDGAVGVGANVNF